MNRTAQTTADPIHSEPGPNPTGYLTDDRFRLLLGDIAWARLPVAIRRRFSKRLSGGASLAYQGVVTSMHLSAIGQVLATLARLFGAPLPFDRSCVDRPAVVVVTEDPSSGGQFWIRQYGRLSGFPQTVYSAKRFSGPTGLEEHLSYGLGMTLRLEAAHDALYLRSDRYFVRLGRLRYYLPRWLVPGDLEIRHVEMGGGRFVFSLDLTHAVFGTLISQEALFRDGEIVDDGGWSDVRTAKPSEG